MIHIDITTISLVAYFSCDMGRYEINLTLIFHINIPINICYIHILISPFATYIDINICYIYWYHHHLIGGMLGCLRRHNAVTGHFSFEQEATAKEPYHTAPYQGIPCHTMAYHTILHHTIPYRTISRHTMSYYTIPHRTIPYCTSGAPQQNVQIANQKLIILHNITTSK